jgi:hypothetical protein
MLDEPVKKAEKAKLSKAKHNRRESSCSSDAEEAQVSVQQDRESKFSNKRIETRSRVKEHQKSTRPTSATIKKQTPKKAEKT